MYILADAASEAISFSYGEASFFKWLALLNMILWPCYLAKNLFFEHREDPRIDRLVEQMAGLASTSLHQSESIRNMLTSVESLRTTITRVANDQAVLEGSLTMRGNHVFNPA